MSASTPTVVATSNLTYTIAVTNAGPSTSSNVVVTDTLPIGSAVSAAHPSRGSVNAAAGLVTWNVGSLAYGGTASLSLVIQAAAAGTMTNSATVTSTTTADPNPGENTDSVITTVVPPTADLALSMAASPDPVLVGANLTYSLTVGNQGPATATAVTLADTLPVGMNFISASPSNAFTQVGQVVTFNLGNLESNEQRSATIVVQPTAAALGTPLNVGSVSSPVTDPFKPNNRASVKTVVQDMTLTIAPVSGGVQLSWPANLNCVLQSATNLYPPVVWLPASDVVPVQVGDQMVALVPIGSGNRFFRLTIE
jgi:uncharacterized repeat protein (TIGR01451 family)